MEDLHLPSDLLGLTPATFIPDRQDGNLVAALGPACSRIRRAMARLGRPIVEPPAAPALEASNDTLVSDPNDCLLLIKSWMGARPASENSRAIRFADVDRELKLVPGSARLYLERAAREWGYVKEREGDAFVLFTEDPYRV